MRNGLHLLVTLSLLATTCWLLARQPAIHSDGPNNRGAAKDVGVSLVDGSASHTAGNSLDKDGGAATTAFRRLRSSGLEGSVEAWGRSAVRLLQLS
jgi:hypothetical protein